MKKTILVLGGGFAGMTALHNFKKTLGHTANIILIDPRVTSLNKPSLPEVAIDGKPVEQVRFLLSDAVKHLGYDLIQDAVTLIKPKEKEVILEKGGSLSYDYLLITIGIKKDFAAIPGFFEYGYSMCDDIQAPRLYRALKEFKGGNVVIGSSPFVTGNRVDAPDLDVPCEGPIGEMMFMIDDYLTKKGLRSQSAINVFSPSKKFFDDVGPRVHQIFGPIIKKHNINVVEEKTIKQISKDQVVFEDGTHLKSDLTIIIPPFKSNAVINKSGLGDEAGYIPTNITEMRHLDYPSIFSAGDSNALSVPKLGHIAVIQAEIAAKAIAKELGINIEVPTYNPTVTCIMNRGNHEATLIHSTYAWGGDIDTTIDGLIPYTMKWGFDHTYNFTKGSMPPKIADKILERYLETKDKKEK